jgi:hypothetical protein
VKKNKKKNRQKDRKIINVASELHLTKTNPIKHGQIIS